MEKSRLKCIFAIDSYKIKKVVQAKIIKERITANGENNLYVVNDFADMQNDSVVTRTLARLAQEGKLVRLAQGLYLYPARNRFGIQKPDIDTIAETIAKKYQADIIPSGLTALNVLGLSTQVPMNAVYITNGTPRTINIGNRKILFKKGTPKYFSFKSRKFAMIVLAMKEIGEKGMTQENLSQILHLIQMEQQEIIQEDLKIAPQWIRRMLNHKCV